MPIRLHYTPSLVRLAACLGDDAARAALESEARQELDDAFAVLMSCSDVAYGRAEFDFGVPRLWPYTLEAAMRMALAVFRDFLPEWHGCFQSGRADIPSNVPSDFAPRVIAEVTKWVVEPSSFSWDEHATLYGWIADDVCLDGYLANDFPKVPRVVSAYCYGACYLIDIENCQPEAGVISHTYDPQGNFAARTADAIACFLIEGVGEGRVREAIRRELVPWCLGRADCLRVQGLTNG